MIGGDHEARDTARLNARKVILNILVFGATGATGNQVVAQAIAQGRVVTAFVRKTAVLSY